MLIRILRNCYNNFKANSKILLKLLYAILLFIFIFPLLLVFKGFYDIRIFLATVNVRLHFIRRHPKIKRTYFFTSPFYEPLGPAICYIVANNKELQSAKQNGFEDELIEVTKKMLARYRYIKRAIPDVQIKIVSQEAIDAAGGYDSYFH